jgi:hypothetical protein
MEIGKSLDETAGKKPDGQATKPANDWPPATHSSVASKFTMSKLLAVLLIIGVSFFIGAAYQKSHQTAATALNSNGSGSTHQYSVSSGGGFDDSGSFGRGSSLSTAQVTAVSGNSITVKDSSGNSQTYAIASNTRITNSGQPVTASAITTGQSVIIIPSRINTSLAHRIIINPATGSVQSPSDDFSQTQLN